MELIQIIGVIVLIIFIIVIFIMIIHQKLKEIDELLNNSWKELVLELNNRFFLISSFLNFVKKSIDKTYIDKIDELKELLESEEQKDIINASIELEKNLNQILIILEDKNVKIDKWKRKLENSKNNFVKVRLKYNDANLRMCNMVKLLPFSIVASIWNYNYLEYFRTED